MSRISTAVTELVQSYLNSQDASDPPKSPHHADLAGFPPSRNHVADDEMLLDDSIRFVEHAVTAGVDAHVDVGKWMVHGFVGAVGQLQAATESLNRIGIFCQDDLQHPPGTEDPRAIGVAAQ